MVFITKVLYFTKVKKVPRKYLRNAFIDSLRLHVRGGSGGNGLPKFGGIGGQGGNVYLIAKENYTLENVVSNNKSKRISAKHGRDSSHNFILGVPGENIKVDVPTGVTLYTDDGRKIGELNNEGEEFVAAKGGTGGNPKNGFLGVEGQNRTIKLDLKLISDIGLVGFPNAGKSTILKAVSQAKPKIASYPFTTIRPNVGIMVYKDFRQISMADLPGLIEGAHVNRGMGHKFLKHVERTKLILLVVDINGFQLSPKHEFRSCLDTIILLNKELEMYNVALLNKPVILVINKMDIDGALEKFDEIKHKIKNISECFCNYPQEMRPETPLCFHEIITMSAKNGGKDIELLKDKLRHLLDVFASTNETESKIIKNMEIEQNERGPLLV